MCMFKRGREGVQDDPREVRPKSLTAPARNDFQDH